MKFGDKVTFTEKAYKQNIPSKQQMSRGAIGLICEDVKDEFIDVIWKGQKQSHTYDEGFIKQISE